MAVLNTLAAIGRFIRRTPPPPADLLEAYAHEVIPVMDRAEWLYEYWLEQSTLFTDGEKLGNVAAIHRWETATMGRSLDRVIPPSVLAGAHEQVVDALELASRAAQLLSNGSRYHNANAVCEGQAMLAVSRERRLAALKSMRRYLARVQPAADADGGAASTEMLAEAAALVTQASDAAPEVTQAADAPTDVLPPQEDPVPDVAVAEDGQAVGAVDGETDLVMVDEAEPEPAWLSAARPAAEQAETTEDRAGGPTASAGAADATEDGPVDGSHDERAAESPDKRAAESPDKRAAGSPDRAGWGSLFGKPPEEPGR